jgi:hypothetical protein
VHVHVGAAVEVVRDAEVRFRSAGTPQVFPLVRFATVGSLVGYLVLLGRARRFDASTPNWIT